MGNTVTRLLLAVAVLAPGALTAQAAPATSPFKVIRIYRETVKPGKSYQHTAHEEAWAGAIVAAKGPTPMLAMTAISGAPENWYMTAFPTWADAEKNDKFYATTPALAAIDKQFNAKEDEYLSDGRMMVLTYREDLSYSAPLDMATARYFSVTRVTVRPGHNAEYEANRKMVKAAHESIKATDHFGMYQAAVGAPLGTYFLFVPRASLAEIDEDATIHGPAYLAALGDSVARNKMTANTSSAIVSMQTDQFAFAPQQSVPAPQWIAAAPGYWTHKPAPKKTP